MDLDNCGDCASSFEIAQVPSTMASQMTSPQKVKALRTGLATIHDVLTVGAVSSSVSDYLVCKEVEGCMNLADEFRCEAWLHLYKCGFCVKSDLIWPSCLCNSVCMCTVFLCFFAKYPRIN